MDRTKYHISLSEDERQRLQQIVDDRYESALNPGPDTTALADGITMRDMDLPDSVGMEDLGLCSR